MIRINLRKFHCQCGCGNEVKLKSHHMYSKVPKYISGHNGKDVSVETRRKISEKLKNKKKPLRSEEHCRKLSEVNKGKKQSEAHIRKRCEKLKGNSWNKNKRRPEEVCRKISAANKNKSKYQWNMVEKQCECGCGRILTRKYKVGIDSIPRFICGHFAKTVEGRKKMQEQTLGKLSPKKGKKCSTVTVDKMSKAAVRKIVMYGCNSGGYRCAKRGVFYSQKNQKEIKYESSYELQTYQKLEQDERVKNYDRCRFSIDYMFKDGIHKYIPDIHVMYIDNTEEIIEVKPEYLLEDNQNVAKFKAAKEYCKKNSLKFNVWIEKEIFGDEYGC